MQLIRRKKEDKEDRVYWIVDKNGCRLRKVSYEDWLEEIRRKAGEMKRKGGHR